MSPKEGRHEIVLGDNLVDAALTGKCHTAKGPKTKAFCLFRDLQARGKRRDRHGVRMEKGFAGKAPSKAASTWRWWTKNEHGCPGDLNPWLQPITEICDEFVMHQSWRGGDNLSPRGLAGIGSQLSMVRHEQSHMSLVCDQTLSVYNLQLSLKVHKYKK